MIDGKRVLAVIPARGGSKGVPGKNLALVGGKPLLAWSVAAAQASSHVDRCLLSSDDADILAAGAACHVETLRRPAKLAGDQSAVGEALLHALDAVGEEWDYLVLLQPTSPLRSAADIDGCLELCHERGAPACVSVSEPAKSPWWMFGLDSDSRLTPLLERPQDVPVRRQELPRTWSLNGAVYVARVDWFRQTSRFLGPDTLGFQMPRSRSLDIDEPFDLELVRALFDRRAGG